MAAYVNRFEGTGVSVFSPITPSLPSWVGDVPTFTEWARWFGSTPAVDVAHLLNNPELHGELGYVYMIIDVGMAALANMTDMLHPSVRLVGYRELISLAKQKQEYEDSQKMPTRTTA